MSIALNEAAEWADELMDAEWQGRKDRESTVRWRLSRKIGVPESYLFRLKYKLREMKTVNGDVYRALMIARRAYGEACQSNERAAAAYRAERLELKAARNAVDQERAQAGVGTDGARH